MNRARKHVEASVNAYLYKRRDPPWVAIRIRCQGHLHRVQWKPRGPIRILDHTQDDIAAQRVAEAIGGKPCECLQMKDAIIKALKSRAWYDIPQRSRWGLCADVAEAAWRERRLKDRGDALLVRKDSVVGIVGEREKPWAYSEGTRQIAELLRNWRHRLYESLIEPMGKHFDTSLLSVYGEAEEATAYACLIVSDQPERSIAASGYRPAVLEANSRRVVIQTNLMAARRGGVGLEWVSMEDWTPRPVIYFRMLGYTNDRAVVVIAVTAKNESSEFDFAPPGLREFDQRVATQRWIAERTETGWKATRRLRPGEEAQ